MLSLLRAERTGKVTGDSLKQAEQGCGPPQRWEAIAAMYGYPRDHPERLGTNGYRVPHECLLLACSQELPKAGLSLKGDIKGFQVHNEPEGWKQRTS